jgi:hypothetical protein
MYEQAREPAADPAPKRRLKGGGDRRIACPTKEIGAARRTENFFARGDELGGV